MRFVLIGGAAILALVHGLSPARADLAHRTRDALKAITDTADNICGNIPMSGEQTSVEFKGEIKTQLKGLAKKLVGFGVDGAGNVSNKTYEGLIQKDVPEALKDTRNCKQHIFDILKPTFFPSPPKTGEVNPETDKTYTLQPDDEPTPPTDCDANMPFDGDGRFPADALTILLADNTILFAGNGKITALTIGQCRAVSMTRDEDEIHVEATVYDKSGKLVARVSENKIHAIKNEKINPTQGGDLSTLIITNDLGERLLHLKYLNPKAIIVEGIFGCPGHTPVDIQYRTKIGNMWFSHSCSRFNYSPATALIIP